MGNSNLSIKYSFLFFLIFSIFSCSNSYDEIKSKPIKEILEDLTLKGYSVESIAKNLNCSDEEVLIAMREGDKSVTLQGKNNLYLLYYSIVEKNKAISLNRPPYMTSFLNSSYSKKIYVGITDKQRKALELQANNLFFEKMIAEVKKDLQERQDKFINNEFGLISNYKNMFLSIFYSKERFSKQWNRKIDKAFDLTDLKEKLYFLAKDYSSQINNLRYNSDIKKMNNDSNEFFNLVLPQIGIADLNLTDAFRESLLNEIYQEIFAFTLIKIIIIILVLVGVATIPRKLIGIGVIVLSLIIFVPRSCSIQRDVENLLTSSIDNYKINLDLNIIKTLNNNTNKYYEELDK